MVFHDIITIIFLRIVRPSLLIIEISWEFQEFETYKSKYASRKQRTNRLNLVL